MATKRNKTVKPRRPTRRETRAVPPEDRRAEAVTVAWMLTTVAAAAAEFAGLVVYLVIRFSPADTEFPEPLKTFPGLMVFTALVLGLVCLLLIPLVYQFRRVPPPLSVTMMSVAVAVLPIALIGIGQLL